MAPDLDIRVRGLGHVAVATSLGALTAKRSAHVATRYWWRVGLQPQRQQDRRGRISGRLGHGVPSRRAHDDNARDGEGVASMNMRELAYGHPSASIAAVISARAGAPYTAKSANAAKVWAYMPTSCGCVIVRKAETSSTLT